MTNNISKKFKKTLMGILVGLSVLGINSQVNASNTNTEISDRFLSPIEQIGYHPPLVLPDKIYPFNQRIKNMSSYINSEIFECTAYCEAGVSANGTDISGGAWYYVAVDPYIIPLGSTLYIEFFGEYASYSGYYLAVDTGGAVYGNIIDVFVGDGAYDVANHFGRRTCRVTLIN